MLDTKDMKILKTIADIESVQNEWVEAVKDVYADYIDRYLNDPAADPEEYAEQAECEAIDALSDKGYSVYKAADGTKLLEEGRHKAFEEYGMNPYTWG